MAATLTCGRERTSPNQFWDVMVVERKLKCRKLKPQAQIRDKDGER